MAPAAKTGEKAKRTGKPAASAPKAKKTTTTKAPAGKKPAPVKKSVPARKAAPPEKTVKARVVKPKGKKAPAKKSGPKTPEIAALAPVEKAPPVQDAQYHLAQRLARLMLDKKADDVTVLSVGDLTSFADYFVICSVPSDRQVQVMGRAVLETMKQEGHPPISREGEDQAHWMLMDFGGVIAHVFYEAARTYYDLDGLWSDAPRIKVAEDTTAKRQAASRRAASLQDTDDDE